LVWLNKGSDYIRGDYKGRWLYFVFSECHRFNIQVMIMFVYNFINKNSRIWVICLGTRNVYMPWTLYFFGTDPFARPKYMLFFMFAYIHYLPNIISVFKNPVFNYTESFTFAPITYKLVAYRPVCKYFSTK